MPAHAQVTLDTTAPNVEVETPVEFLVPGFLVTVYYTTDETIGYAVFDLNGDEVTAAIYADRVEAMVPLDASPGPARLFLSDDVLNGAWHDLPDVQTGESEIALGAAWGELPRTAAVRLG